jgi:hypothetical protein
VVVPVVLSVVAMGDGQVVAVVYIVLWGHPEQAVMAL